MINIKKLLEFMTGKFFSCVKSLLNEPIFKYFFILLVVFHFCFLLVQVKVN